MVRLPARARDLALPRSVQAVSGAHAASYSMCTVCSFPGVKRPGNVVDHSPASITRINHEWSCAPFHPIHGITSVFSLSDHRAYHTLRIFLIIFYFLSKSILIHIPSSWNDPYNAQKPSDISLCLQCQVCHMIRIRPPNL